MTPTEPLVPVKLFARYYLGPNALPPGYIVGLPESEVRRLEGLHACERMPLDTRAHEPSLPTTPTHEPRARVMPSPVDVIAPKRRR